MSTDIKQLRVRIKSVASTKQLTKAMGLVASSKIRKSIDAMQKGREYSMALSDMVSQLTLSRECEKSPYMADREAGRVVLVVIAGDRGLAGGYNANVFRFMKDYDDALVIPIGKRACDRYGYEMCNAEYFSYTKARKIAVRVCEEFCRGEISRFGVVYTRYHSMMSQETAVRWFLPLAKAEKKEAGDVIFEPDALSVLNEAVPEYVAGGITAAVKESVASEVAARRVAMDNADKNAEEMLSKLSLAYNRARQGAITQEITEIVAGSGL